MTDKVVAEIRAVLVGELDDESTTALIDLDDLVVTDPTHFGVDVHVYSGSVGDRGSDSFDMIVCSPSWFAQHAALDEDWALLRQRQAWTDSDAVLLGTGLWFMRRWSVAEFQAVLARVCAEASGGPDWETVASRIGRWIPWEFDDRHDEDVDEGLVQPNHASRRRAARREVSRGTT